MRIFLFLFLYIIFSMQWTYSQINDNFNDDLLEEWECDKNQWKSGIQDELLQLMADTAGTAPLCQLTEIFDSLAIDFQFVMEFSPSASNTLEIFLYADTISMDQLTGYSLYVGENGTDDAFVFRKYENGISEELYRFESGHLGEDPAESLVEIRRTPEGVWTVEVKYGDGGTESAMITDPNPFLPGEGYFMIYPTFTSTRTDKYFFDYVRVEKWTPDLIPPEIENITVLDATSVRVEFSEPVDPAISIASINTVPPVPISDVQASGNVLIIFFQELLLKNLQYTLRLTDISDTEGNTASLLSGTFTYNPPHIASHWDVIINEIHFQPASGEALPNVEYIELYNSGKSVNLEDWTVSDGATIGELNSFILDSGEYVLVIEEGDEDLFPQISVVTTDNLPGLNNNGDLIILENSSGKIIDAVNYTPSWLKDSDKIGEGYALERIRQDLPCVQEDNWTYSRAIIKGTPGKKNEVPSLSEPDPLVIENVSLPDPFTIQVTFNHSLSPESGDPGNVNITPAVDILNTMIISPIYSEVEYILEQFLDEEQIYTLQISADDLSPCNSILAPQDNLSASFGIPGEAEGGDLFITEILFDPEDEDAEYIEIFNNSGHFIALNTLALKVNDDTHFLSATSLFPPKTYAAFSEDPVLVDLFYEVPNPEFLFREDIPSLNNKEGRVVLLAEGETGDYGVIDSIYYNEDLHHPFIDDTEGVALEKIFLTGSFDPANWTSAAETAGYGTPTGENSQFIEPSDKKDNIHLISESFSPDGDGFEDVLIARYEFEKPGYSIYATVFALNGQEVAKVAKGLITASAGNIVWDGRDNDAVSASPGIYVLHIEYLHPDGDYDEVKFGIALIK